MNAKWSSLPKDHKIPLKILYECYIAQADLLEKLLDNLEERYQDHFTDTENVPEDELYDVLEHNNEIADIYYDEDRSISELKLLHVNMLDNAEEISCHLIGGKITRGPRKKHNNKEAQ